MDQKNIVDLFKNTVEGLRNTVDTQTQMRTKKLGGAVEILEEFVTYFDYLTTPAPEVDKDKVDLMKAIGNIKENYGITTHQALQAIEEAFKEGDTDLKKDNQYLRRKLTMYDLKIAKYENEIDELKKELKKRG